MDYIEAKPVQEQPEFMRRGVNVADIRLGAAVEAVSDEFFAPAERMLSPDLPRFYPDRYDDHGKWMDGWESRRRRTVGHDWCIVRLAAPAVLLGVDFDTAFFTGNFAPGVLLEACHCEEGSPDEHTEWTSLFEPVSLSASDHHLYTIANDQAWTHVRVNILPDGGLARLRLYGRPVMPAQTADETFNLAALEYGAQVIAFSDSHYGDPNKVLLPQPGINMGDGWETRRLREPGNDWCIIRLATPGIIEKVDVDTAFFKGNYPAGLSLQAARVDATTDQAIITQSMFWPELMSRQPLSADNMHHFDAQLNDAGAVTHVKVNIYPDGGLSRVRIWGRKAGK